MGDFNDNDNLTGICNSALAVIGHTDFIDDIEADNPVARSLRVLVKQVCREVQTHENASWQELEQEASLTKKRTNDHGITEWNLPIHMISPISCFVVKDGKRGNIPYEITGGVLCSVEKEGVRLRYMKFSFDPANWSAELKTCVIKLLAARALSALVKEFSAAHRMEQQFWAFDFPLWVGNSKNKARRNDFAGNDQLLTQFY